MRLTNLQKRKIILKFPYFILLYLYLFLTLSPLPSSSRSPILHTSTTLDFLFRSLYPPSRPPLTQRAAPAAMRNAPTNTTSSIPHNCYLLLQSKSLDTILIQKTDTIALSPQCAVPIYIYLHYKLAFQKDKKYSKIMAESGITQISLHRRQGSNLSQYQTTCISKHYALNNQILAAFESHYRNELYQVAFHLGLKFVETALLEIPKVSCCTLPAHSFYSF